jgi:hypothetical protein
VPYAGFAGEITVEDLVPDGSGNPPKKMRNSFDCACPEPQPTGAKRETGIR